MTTTGVAEGAAYDLSDFDLASRLSFLLRPLSPQPDTGGALPAVVLTAYPPNRDWYARLTTSETSP